MRLVIKKMFYNEMMNRFILIFATVIATNPLYANEPAPHDAPAPKPAPKPAAKVAAKATPKVEAAPNEKSIEAFWDIARTQFEVRDYLKAAQTLEELVKVHPKHWEARPIGAWFYWEASKRTSGRERSSLEKSAETFIMDGLKDHADSWLYNREVGDFYRLRAGSISKAYPYYNRSVETFASATPVQKASLLDRLARSAEELGRNGDAVTASCRALEFDAKDQMALARIAKWSGNCKRKGINLDLENEHEAAPESPKSHGETSH